MFSRWGRTGVETAVHMSVAKWQKDENLPAFLRYIAQRGSFHPTWRALRVSQPPAHHDAAQGPSGDRVLGAPHGPIGTKAAPPPRQRALNASSRKGTARGVPGKNRTAKLRVPRGSDHVAHVAATPDPAAVSRLLKRLNERLSRCRTKAPPPLHRLPSSLEIAVCSVAESPQQLRDWIRQGLAEGLPDLLYAFSTLIAWYRSLGDPQVGLLPGPRSVRRSQGSGGSLPQRERGGRRGGPGRIWHSMGKVKCCEPEVNTAVPHTSGTHVPLKHVSWSLSWAPRVRNKALTPRNFLYCAADRHHLEHHYWDIVQQGRMGFQLYRPTGTCTCTA